MWCFCHNATINMQEAKIELLDTWYLYCLSMECKVSPPHTTLTLTHIHIQRFKLSWFRLVVFCICRFVSCCVISHTHSPINHTNSTCLTVCNNSHWFIISVIINSITSTYCVCVCVYSCFCCCCCLYCLFAKACMWSDTLQLFNQCIEP